MHELDHSFASATYNRQLIYEDHMNAECSASAGYLGTSYISLFLGLLQIGLFSYLFFVLGRNEWVYWICVRLPSQQISNLMVIPIYEGLLVTTAAFSVLIGALRVIGIFNNNTIYFTVKWAAMRFLSEGIAVFLMHNGVGRRAVITAIAAAGVWAGTSGVLMYLLYHIYGYDVFISISLGLLILLFIFYLGNWLLPAHFLHRRPSMILLARSYVCVIIIFVLSIVVLKFETDPSGCVANVFFAIADIIQPLLVLRAVFYDSLFWQGLYSRGTKNLNEPLLGVWDDMPWATVDLVAQSISRLEQAEEAVPIIPFGQLALDTSQYFSGGSARVYRGRFKSQEVAIKFLFCLELTPSRVLDFCKEAALLHSLRHPHVVRCLGVAVMPPAMCLVTEYCSYGSLFDFLHMVAEGGDALSLQDHSEVADLELSLSMSRKTMSSSEVEGKYSLTEALIATDVLRDSSCDPTGRGSFMVKPPTSSRVSMTERNSFVLDRANQVRLSESFNQQTFSDRIKDDIVGSAHCADALRGGKRTSISSNSSNFEIREDPLGAPMRSASFVMRESFLGFGMGPTDIELPVDPPRMERQRSDSVRSVKSVLSTRSAGQMLLQGAVNSRGYYLSLPLRLKMAYECCQGIAFLHSKGIMHCDIKSLNYLVARDFSIRLADLGEARRSDGLDRDQFQSIPRNINWSAPEVLSDKASFDVDCRADVWSLAMVIAEVLTSEVPFDAVECRTLGFDQFIEALRNNMRPQLPERILVEFPWIVQMLESGWAFDPENRCTAAELADMIRDRGGSLLEAVTK